MSKTRIITFNENLCINFDCYKLYVNGNFVNIVYGDIFYLKIDGEIEVKAMFYDRPPVIVDDYVVEEID